LLQIVQELLTLMILGSAAMVLGTAIFLMLPYAASGLGRLCESQEDS